MTTTKAYPVALAVFLTACGGGGGDSGGGNGGNTTPVSFFPPFTATVFENSQDAYVARATTTSGTNITYAFAGGADAGQFSIDAHSGEVRFTTSPDFESPTDSGSNNVYDIRVSASDGAGNTASRDVAISVADVSNLTSETTFPTPGAELGGGASLLVVAGVLTDLEDGQVLAGDVSFVDVNGVAGTQSLSSPERWSAIIPIQQPGGPVTVTVESQGGGTETDNFVVTNQEDMLQADEIVIDQARNRAIIGVFPNKLVAIDLDTGFRTVISSNDIGSGIPIRSVRSMAIDEAADTVYVHGDSSFSPLGAIIYAVDLATGDRRIISSATVGSGPMLPNTFKMAFNPDDGKLYSIHPSDGGQIHSLAVDTGERALVSGDTRGAGLGLGNVKTLALDSANNRALAYGSFQLFGVDLDTGDRTVLSTDYENAGPVVFNAQDLILDSAQNSVLVTSPGSSEIIAIDLTTGDRTSISSATVGSGTPFREPYTLAWESLSESVLSLDAATQTILRVDTQTGDRSVFSGNIVGEGESINSYSYFDIASDAIYIVHNRIFEGYSLFRIDLTTGNRSPVTASGTLPTGFSVAVSEPRGKVFWFGGSFPEFWVYAIDVQTGALEVVSSTATGAGPAIQNLVSGDIDEAGNRAVVLDAALPGIYGIDLNTGDRTLLSGPTAGSGPAFLLPRQLVLTPDGDVAYVTDPNLNAIFSVALSTGERSIISSSVVGGGSALDFPQSLAIDDSGNTLYVVNSGNVIAVNINNGSRQLVTVANLGFGAEFAPSGDVVYDSGRNRLFVGVGPVSGLAVVDIPSGGKAIFSR